MTRLAKPHRLAGALLVASLAFIGGPTAPTIGFEHRPERPLRVAIPDIELTTRDQAQLRDGKAVRTLIGTAGGRRAGRLEVIMPFDPVTAFMVATDSKHLHLTDPSYPESGSVRHKRRTYMPYVFDSAICVAHEQTHVYQLVVPPLVRPRKQSFARKIDQSAFPWEMAWRGGSGLECAEHRNPEMESIYEKAVTVRRSVGAWHIGPVPAHLRESDADLLRSHVVLYVDIDLGGKLGERDVIVNRSMRTSLGRLADNLAFHGSRWRRHLRHHHDAADVAEYDRLVAAYRRSVGLAGR